MFRNTTIVATLFLTKRLVNRARKIHGISEMLKTKSMNDLPSLHLLLECAPVNPGARWSPFAKFLAALVKRSRE